jgi:hypothetical protein
MSGRSRRITNKAQFRRYSSPTLMKKDGDEPFDHGVEEGREKGRECFTYRIKNSGLVIVGVGTVES